MSSKMQWHVLTRERKGQQDGDGPWTLVASFARLADANHYGHKLEDDVPFGSIYVDIVHDDDLKNINVKKE